MVVVVGRLFLGTKLVLLLFIHKPPPGRGGIGHIQARCSGQVGRHPPVFLGLPVFLGAYLSSLLGEFADAPTQK